MDQPILSRLRALLLKANALPLYQNRFQVAGLTPTLLRQGSAEEIWQGFAKIPITNQATVRQQSGDLLTSVDDLAYRGVTSGSQGTAYIYFRDQRWNDLRLKSMTAALASWQITAADTIVNVCSRLYPLQSNNISLVGLPDGELRSWLRTLARNGAIVLRGFSSRLSELVIQEDWQQLAVKAVICTGEPLFEHQIALFQQAFNCPVINEYGSQECGLQLWSCPRCEQLHPHSERCWLEVINHALVVTDLYSDLMPLIRYRNGDRVDLRPSNCTGGDFVLIPQGREGEQLQEASCLPALDSISYYRILEREPERLRLLYLPHRSDCAPPPHLPSAPGYPTEWSLAADSIDFWNQIHPLPLSPASLPTLPKHPDSLALANYITACLESERWIFYTLPKFMQSAQPSLAERQDFCEGEAARTIDDCLLRLLCYAPPPSVHLQAWLELLEQRQVQSHRDGVRVEYVALKAWLLGEAISADLPILPLDKAAYRSVLALLENMIRQSRRQQPGLPILQVPTLLALFLTDLTHYYQNLPAVFTHWAVLLGRPSAEPLTLPAHLLNRELFLQGKPHKQLTHTDETKDLVESCLQALWDDSPDRLIQVWEYLKIIASQNLPASLAACYPASFARRVAAAYLAKGERGLSYNALLSMIFPLPQQESFDRHTQICNGKQRLW